MPESDVDTLLMLRAEVVPEEVRSWLASIAQEALLASLELLPDGRLVIQVLPDVDPRLVASVRRVMAQHEDVLRRLA